MVSSNEKALLGYAKRILKQSGLQPREWVIGGGTVLKYFYSHRISQDIDIFFDNPQRLSALSPRVNDAVDGEYDSIREMGNYIKYYFPEGKIDFVVAGRITDFEPQKHDFFGDEVFLDDPVEIVAKKLYHRCDRFYPRDFFDLAIVYESERGNDLIEAAAKMPVKIELLEKRISSFLTSGDMGKDKPFQILDAGKHIDGREIEIANEFVGKVREFLGKKTKK
jgi:hypothetical protein